MAWPVCGEEEDVNAERLKCKAVWPPAGCLTCELGVKVTLEVIRSWGQERCPGR